MANASSPEMQINFLRRFEVSQEYLSPVFLFSGAPFRVYFTLTMSSLLCFPSL